MSVAAKYYCYVRSPTLCTRYGEPWRPLSVLGAWGRLFAVWESNGAYNTVDTNVDAYNTILCQGDCGVLFPHAYRVWPLVSWFDLCAAFFFRTWSFTSGHPRLDGSNRPWPRQSEKSGTLASYGSLVGVEGSE